MEKFVFLCIFLVGTFLKLSDGQVTCNNKNTDVNCGAWQTAGYCTHTYVDYMKKNCMKTCRFCATPAPTGTGVTCKNKQTDALCSDWQNAGYCTHTYAEYMRKNCLKACGTCDAVNCAWGKWSAWEACSVTCGSGTKKRTRAESTSASNGGRACQGLAKASESCKLNACPDPVCGPKVTKLCAPLQTCFNPGTPSAKCGALVCGKTLRCPTGQECINPDTPCATCGALICGEKLRCKTIGHVCSNPDTPLAKCGNPVCGPIVNKKCLVAGQECIHPDTPCATCEFKCGKEASKCDAASTKPSCLDTTGKTLTDNRIIDATCQCTATTCVSGSSAKAKAPVCGTADNGAVLAKRGVCNKCAMGKNGLGEASKLGKSEKEPTGGDSTCPATKGCCIGGECVLTTLKCPKHPA